MRKATIIHSQECYENVVKLLNKQFNNIFEESMHNSPVKVDTLFAIREKIISLGLELKDHYGVKVKELTNAYLYETIIISDNVTIMPGSVIEGPCIIGPGTRIGPSAYIHGPCFIGKNSRIGHCCEVKSSVLLSGVKAYHYSFIGDSFIGKNTNIGAGTVFSVKRTDGNTVHFQPKYKEKLDFSPKKYGAMVGNNVQFGIGCMVMPGAVIQADVSIRPNTLLKAKK